MPEIFTARCWTGALLTLATLISPLSAKEPHRDEVVRRLIAELDHDRFAVRRRAQQKLLEVGNAAIPQLIKASQSTSAEVRYRARQILLRIRRNELTEKFRRLSEQEDDQINYDEAMWLISRIANPQVRRADLDRQLDEIAATVRRRLGRDVEPKNMVPEKIVDALVAVLKDEFKFRGNTTDYSNPDNSLLDRVLATKQGLPILLSHVAVAVAERLDVPIVGLQIPGRYMIKYDGAQAPKGHEKLDIIIDPFGDWLILTAEEVKQRIPSFDPAQHLTPTTRRAAVARMMQNLINHLSRAGRADEAQLAYECRELLLKEQSGPAL